ncbi:phosphatidic acid phosphatase [Clostridiaceae bacterium OttesenSCG-928-D20]|nr:phosphatidic acid phosphatase [Clostridiaceae bacterium OttesenSCG-928-D20]
MKFPAAVRDYRRLRINNISSDEFKHLKLLMFWPIFGILFAIVERYYIVDYYYPIHSPIDDLIPFNELFLIPYLFWFVFLVGMHLYTLVYDIDCFERMIKYIILTYFSAITIYIIFPNCQLLRPTEFARDNILTRFIQGFYQFDTNTNVCPSIHVIGSLAVMEAGLYSKTIKSKWIKAGFVITAVLICASTVFMKQHSIIDVIAALPICLLARHLFFGEGALSRSKERQVQSI